MKVTYFSPNDVQEQEQTKVLAENTYNWFMRVGVVGTVVLGFVYLVLLNQLATQGFDLETLKAERLLLQKELEQVEIELAIPESLYALQSFESVQAMGTVEEQFFMLVDSNEVAMIDRRR